MNILFGLVHKNLTAQLVYFLLSSFQVDIILPADEFLPYSYPETILQSLAVLSEDPKFADTTLVFSDGTYSAPRVLLYITYPALQVILKEREEDEKLDILLPQISMSEASNLLKHTIPSPSLSYSPPIECFNFTPASPPPPPATATPSPSPHSPPLRERKGFTNRSGRPQKEWKHLHRTNKLRRMKRVTDRVKDEDEAASIITCLSKKFKQTRNTLTNLSLMVKCKKLSNSDTLPREGTS